MKIALCLSYFFVAADARASPSLRRQLHDEGQVHNNGIANYITINVCNVFPCNVTWTWNFLSSDPAPDVPTNTPTSNPTSLPTSSLTNSSNETNDGFALSMFDAQYYQGDQLVYAETVDRPSMNYAWSEFHEIPSPEFVGIWNGTLDILEPPEHIVIEFNLNPWSNVSLEVDGQVQSLGQDDSIAFTFADPGSHDIVVTYRNGWHTVNFNSFFGKREWLTLEEASASIATQELIKSNTYLVHLTITANSDTHNDVLVVLDDSINDAHSSVFLVLGNLGSMNWVVENHSNLSVTGIAFGAYNSATSVDTSLLPDSVPVFGIKGERLDFANEGFSGAVATITGNVTPSRIYDERDIDHIVVQAL